ncbi:uncharacterized protein NP_1042A [Natronomonas pharaonis DSM 2160]|uniref:Uncharacterized protein n=1 Tax=Natronomonas pharaonis (strain ATCC 35678 / DSM 2160 / CIP 103997 / JCM 8858 / NBRC 14720 / NCIMB 2260 / Gabara) TaxID=348780 RepID=A0A1U7EUH1_NATPD|nr:hypothetical protein [Natronomonas pharaonis]CAI48612.1 uncharacterized protein NP_1042A [Natronomonas pharaonis DSM 2160]
MLNRIAEAVSVADDERSFRQRAGGWVASVRVFVGLLLLYELTVGGWWKLGAPQLAWPPFEPNPGWVGENAGEVLANAAAGRAIEEGTYSWYAALLEGVVLPYAGFWSVVAVVAQLAVGLAFVVGFWNRPAAVVGLLYFVPVFHFGTIRTSPLFGVPIAFLLVTRAGHHYGLDGLIAARSGRLAQLSDRIATLSVLPRPSRSVLPGAVAALSVLSVYYLLSVPGREVTRQALVGLEVAVMLGLVAGGLALYYRGGEPVAVAADMVRAFVGYRFLHEVFVRDHAGVNGLPGWASVDAQAELLAETIVPAHVGPVATAIETVVLPTLPFWVVVFAAVQTAVGAALLVGYRTRLAGTVGAGYLVVLIGLGFVRLAPLLFASALVAATLSGRYASLDAVAGRRPMPPRLRQQVAAPAAAGAAVLFAGGAILGIDPEAGYGAVVGPVALVMLAFVLAAIAVAAAGATKPAAESDPVPDAAATD